MKLKRTSSNAGGWTILCSALALSAFLFPSALNAAAGDTDRQVMVRDITNVEGVRDNLLVGYGLVTGLRGTGDTQQTIFTMQTLANAMQKMGVLVPAGTAVVKNVAAVFITASLPPFARPGAKLDVTVSSVGDARSLEGGILLMSALRGPDGQIYAEAQGPLVMGGYVAGDGANRKEVNSANVGMIPNGAIIERDTAVDLKGFKTVSLLLRNPDFATATQIAETVNREFKKPVAIALDSRRIDVSVADASEQSVPQLIARVQSLMLTVNTPAKIVINERTGTIVLGGSVKLLPVSVIHGSLSIQVVTTYAVVPGGMMPGQKTPTPATLVPETRLNVNEAPAQSMRLDEGANVEELVNGLHAIGTTARDVVAILQAIKAEGGIQAELEIQ
jgi:flagellar P-ring protein precursor FlgI